ncbi:hypothetical protein RND81_11G018900 [Saponaria officinalis]|uniref:GRF-type domain-containing protein n=1 Tax=Saponaria officinalis TaxID=3572 RepID=A0AAW1HHA8_SAPOF
MSSRISQGSSPMTCHCGKSLALVKSWTSMNPGRRFLACNDYDYETGRRGCDFFQWYDSGQTIWQRDVINKLLVDNKKLAWKLSVKEEEVKKIVAGSKSKTYYYFVTVMIVVVLAMFVVCTLI